MRAPRLGFLSPLALAVTAVALAATAGVIAVQGGAPFSPGALSSRAGEPVGGVRSHAELGSCAACHPRPWSGGAMRDRCRGCHRAVDEELRGAAPLHGILPDGGACLSCHTEHRGARGRLTRDERVPHDALGFSLDAHRRVAAASACADCHATSFAAYTCTGCHDGDRPGFEAAHAAAWGDACVACHDGVDRFGRDRFRHPDAFPLTGRHGPATCVACHEGVRALAGFGDAPRECVACHPEPAEHRGQFGTACGECHSTDSWEGARFAHRFPLDHGSRQRSPCRTCHADAPRYDTYTCYGCHEHTPENIRREHSEEGVRDLEDCVRCHPTGRDEEGEGGEGEGEDDD